MQSKIDPTIVYETMRDVTEHDIDIVSDLWSMGGRQVYRGARDPRYTHANVYWLYNEELDRTGCSEHKLDNNTHVNLLWFQDSPFGTFLQEDGWTEGDSFWTLVPEHVYERFLTEGWTSPRDVLEQCIKNSDRRIVTPSMLAKMPMMYVCDTCKTKSLSPHGRPMPLDFPNKEKIVFVDETLSVQVPPANSRVFTMLPSLGGSSLPAQQPVAAP